MNYANSLAMETIKKTFEINLVPLNLLRGAAMNLLESTDYGKELLRKAVR